MKSNVGELQVAYYEVSKELVSFLERLEKLDDDERINVICGNKETIGAYIDAIQKMTLLFSISCSAEEVKTIYVLFSQVLQADAICRYKEEAKRLVESLLKIARYISAKENKFKKCSCCGNRMLYSPLPSIYEEYKMKNGAKKHVAETLNEEEYRCPCCGANDRDRLMIEFMKKIGMFGNCSGEKILQIAPAEPLEKWIDENCISLEYQSTDLYMEGVTFIADIQNMNMVPDETYDYIICSHVLEHVKDDMAALRELYRIVKNDGAVLFLVPISLDIQEIDEAWGLLEEENWRRFGQGDHCRRYSKEGLVERLQRAGFNVHELGKEYFGEDIFEQAALTETSTLYVLTKTIKNIDTFVNEKYVLHTSEKNDLPQVTVVMSAYNHGKYVEKAIQSVLNQSYKNVYFMVADDASTDDTVDVLMKYENDIDEIHLYDCNSGAGRCRDLVAMTRTKYVALINSDDYWESTKLEKQVSYMEAHPECAACFTWCNEVDGNGNEVNSNVFCVKNRTKAEWMYRFWSEGNCLAHPSILIRTEIYQDLISCNNGVFKQVPDFNMWMKLVQEYDIYIIEEKLVNFVYHKSALSENVSAPTYENTVRDSMEVSFIWYRTMKEMQDSFFREAFKTVMINPQVETHEEILCEKFFVLCMSPIMGVQNAALTFYYDVFADRGLYHVLEEKYGYTNKMFHEFDVQNGFGTKMIEAYTLQEQMVSLLRSTKKLLMDKN